MARGGGGGHGGLVRCVGVEEGMGVVRWGWRRAWGSSAECGG